MPGAPVAFGKPSWEPSGAFHTARCACRCPVSSAPPTQGVVRAAFGKPPGGGGAGRGVPAPRSLRRRCPGLPTRRRRCATSLETGDICSVPEGGLMGRVWPRGFRGPQRPRGRGCQRDPLQCCVARSGDGHTVEGGGSQGGAVPPGPTPGRRGSAPSGPISTAPAAPPGVCLGGHGLCEPGPTPRLRKEAQRDWGCGRGAGARVPWKQPLSPSAGLGDPSSRVSDGAFWARQGTLTEPACDAKLLSGRGGRGVRHTETRRGTWGL